jgi:hypothetical protein
MLKSKSKTRRRCRKSRRCKLSRRVKHRGGTHNTSHRNSGITKTTLRPGFLDHNGPAPVPHPPRIDKDGNVVLTKLVRSGSYFGRPEVKLVRTTIPRVKYMAPIKKYEEELKNWFLGLQTTCVDVLILHKKDVDPNTTSHHDNLWKFIKVQQTGLAVPTYDTVTHQEEPTIPQWPDDRWVTAHLETTIQDLNSENIFCVPANYEVMTWALGGGQVIS